MALAASVEPTSAGRAPTEQLRAAAAEIRRAVRGKAEIVDLALVVLVAGGHLLLEDIPGVGKSTLARALARVSGGEYRRVQFTSDLLPADVLGSNVWLPGEQRFEFHPGPIFTNVLLADEINRAPPRTQSALLEAMGERHVSIEGTTHVLPDPFMVFATQNPSEHHGTYPLPESQRDRFMMRLRIGYADAASEAELLSGGATPSHEVAAIFDVTTLRSLQAGAREVFVHPDIARYAQAIVAATRSHADVALGVSTRGAISWMAAARARAFIDGRRQVVPDDLQTLAVAALAHRVMAGQSRDSTRLSDEIVRDVVARTPVPL